MARSSPAEGRRGRHGIQIDTTDSDQKSEHYPPVIGDPRSANRTPVAADTAWPAPAGDPECGQIPPAVMPSGPRLSVSPSVTLRQAVVIPGRTEQPCS